MDVNLSEEVVDGQSGLADLITIFISRYDLSLNKTLQMFLYISLHLSAVRQG